MVCKSPQQQQVNPLFVKIFVYIAIWRWYEDHVGSKRRYTMKIFDFTDGVKGEQIGFVPRANSTGSHFVEKNGQTYKVELNGSHGKSNEKWSWHTGATYYENGSDVQIDPADFGVGAVCFCFGEFTADKDNYEWWWTVVGTTEWNRNACKSGHLKATKVTA